MKYCITLLAFTAIAMAALNSAEPPAAAAPAPAAKKAAPAPKPPSPERHAAGAFFLAAKAAKLTPAAYAASSPAAKAQFATVLATANVLREKDGRSGRGTAYALYREYEAYLAAGNAPFPNIETPTAFLKRTDAGRYWKNRATAAELLANKSLPFGVRYDSAKRFPWEQRAATQTALFQQAVGTGNLDRRYLKWLRSHVATLPDAEATALLTKEIAVLATAPASKTRDGAVSDYLAILAIRRELAALK